MGSAVSSPVGSRAKLQLPTISAHFEDLETLLVTSKMCIILRTRFVLLCPSLPQQSSQIFFLYFVSQKTITPPFGAPFSGARGYMPPALYPPLLLATAYKAKRTVKKINGQLISSNKGYFGFHNASGPQSRTVADRGPNLNVRFSHL